jgi:hypothetical protein
MPLCPSSCGPRTDLTVTLCLALPRGILGTAGSVASLMACGDRSTDADTPSISRALSVLPLFELRLPCCVHVRTGACVCVRAHVCVCVCGMRGGAGLTDRGLVLLAEDGAVDGRVVVAQ